MIDSFFTIADKVSCEIKVKNSRFISNIFPVTTAAGIQEELRTIREKYYDASHHPYAYRLGTDKNNFKISDDGEPSGTSGKPILEAIDKHNLTNILIVVSRYFGGTKLGTGGLRKAYLEAASQCLRDSKIEEKFITEKLNLEFDYKYMNVIMKQIETDKASLSGNDSGEKCSLIIEVRFSKVEQFKKDLVDITKGSIKISSL